jgi:hypothetical protein
LARLEIRVTVAGKKQHPLQIPATATFAGVLGAGGGRIVWLTLRETTGAAAATVELYDGQNTTGVLIASIELPQGTSKEPTIQPKGLQFQNGLYCNVVAGTVKGAAVVVFDDDWEDYERLPIVVNVPLDEIAQMVAARMGA